MAQSALAFTPTDREQRFAMTSEEWRAWSDAEGRQTEWIDGEVIVFVSSSLQHAQWAWFLSTLLGLYVRLRGLGLLLAAPFEVRLSPRVSREPDILFVARDHLARVEQKRVEGPVDLAVELISDESVTRDRRDKFAQYAEFGVPEYWLLDPRPGQERADFFHLTATGNYEPLPLDADGRVHSRVLPGFWLRPAWLRQDPLPDPLACLVEIAPDALSAASRGGPAAADG